MERRVDASRKRRSSADDEEQQIALPSSKRRGGGGIYVPPYRAMAEPDDDNAGEFGSAEYQRRSWDALRRSITGLVNKATAANARHVALELLAENLVRGRGLLCRALLRSQEACPSLTNVFAALAAVVNARLPCVGRLLLVRLALRVRRAHASGSKHQLAAAAYFVAHLVNQGVAHDLLALELLALLLHDRPTTDAAVEVAVGFVRECGAALAESCPRGLDAVFDTLRGVLHDGDVDRRVQFMIEDLFAVRKARFRGHPPVRAELDLIEAEDQVTHQVELDSDELDPELHLDVFQPSPSFVQDEAAYDGLKRSILGTAAGDEESLGQEKDQCSDDDDDESSGDESGETTELTTIRDDTDTDLINLRRTIYLTLMSSVGAEEAGHKILSVVRPGQELELCTMLVECAKKEKAPCTSYYGRLAQRLCAVGGRAYQAGFEACFAGHYSAAHRMATDELRATARLYVHLLAADALQWRAVLGSVRVTEDDTTSSSRIFVKLLFQDLAEHLGIRALSNRIIGEDTAVRDALFPTDCTKNTRFAINFFTAIGLGGVTESARKLIV